MSTASLRSLDLLTVDEFLTFLDDRPGERWELHDGAPHAMVGSSFAHALIASNIVSALKPVAGRRGCQALSGYLVEAHASGAYEPDALASVGPSGGSAVALGHLRGRGALASH